MNKVKINLSFSINNENMTMICAYSENKTVYVDYMSEETGEIFTDCLHNLDDTTSIEVCRQLQIATNIDYDYRNV